MINQIVIPFLKEEGDALSGFFLLKSLYSLCYIILQKMFNSRQKRMFELSRTFTKIIPIETELTEQQSYQVIQGIFQYNLNKFGVLQSDCLEDLQCSSKLAKNNRPKHIPPDSLKNILSRVQLAFSKEPLRRNCNIKTTLDNYFKLFESSFPRPKENENPIENIKPRPRAKTICCQVDKPCEKVREQKKVIIIDLPIRKYHPVNHSKETISKIHQIAGSTIFSQQCPISTISIHIKNPEIPKANEIAIPHHMILAKMPSRVKRIFMHYKNRYSHLVAGHSKDKSSTHNKFISSISIDTQSSYVRKASLNDRTKVPQKLSIANLEEMHKKSQFKTEESPVMNRSLDNGYRPKSYCRYTDQDRFKYDTNDC